MKTKMSNEKFRVVLIPIIAVICVLGIVLTMAANAYSASLDMALGRGRRHVVKIDGVSPEATEYYDVKFPNPDAGTLNNGDPATEIEEASRNEAAKVALKVGEEGVTLLKNNGVLPLAKNSEVTPFGYRFVSPVWGGAGSAEYELRLRGHAQRSPANELQAKHRSRVGVGSGETRRTQIVRRRV